MVQNLPTHRGTYPKGHHSFFHIYNCVGEKLCSSFLCVFCALQRRNFLSGPHTTFSAFFLSSPIFFAQPSNEKLTSVACFLCKFSFPSVSVTNKQRVRNWVAKLLRHNGKAKWPAFHVHVAVVQCWGISTMNSVGHWSLTLLYWHEKWSCIINY